MPKGKKKKLKFYPFHVYDGKHLLEFESTEHVYYLDGLQVPSVTQVLDMKSKEGLKYWRANKVIEFLEEHLEPNKKYKPIQIEELLKLAKHAADRVSKKALNVGSMVHDWIERYIEFVIEYGVPPEIRDPSYELDTPEGVMFLPHTEESRSSIDAFLSWKELNDVQFLETEKKIVSAKDEWAGTQDTKMIYRDTLCAGDWKTSKAIHPEYFVQVSAYATGDEEMGSDAYDDLIVMRVPKDGGEFEAKSHRELRVGYSKEDLYNEVFLSLKKVWWFNDGRKRRLKKSPNYTHKNK